ncbi:protein Wnt-4-like [Mizuhopecten yessoensis]|uniref:Protein Wnt n=1 Tax=Mizuhopecten yessoensis TaxID=6573 RepID=A0A210QI65_MIZYE|nr:protein Wnt-4-like [Mizuhopecten yessoensis]OWF48432.1 Protein Wnt-4 [Mizuhopecten yessoensis]
MGSSTRHYISIILVCILQSVHASWWYLAILSSSPTSNSPPAEQVVPKLQSDQGSRCSNLAFLTPRQKELCEHESRLLNVVSQGASMGISECQHQFSARRWNCSTYNNTSVFGKVLGIKSRETAYIYAISSAGVMYSVTRGCARGDLEHCGCDDKIRWRKAGGDFEWGGCSENTKYGAKFSKEFVDANEKTVDESGLMNLWNNEAGRRTVKTSMELLCKCHGVSATCSVKICWRKMKSFRAIGAKLKAKFDGASLVKVNKKRRKLKRITIDMKKPTKKDLVYLEESPDYCNVDAKYGSLGTRGRQCSKDSYGLDGCTLMCCGRGYHTIVKEIKENCDCKFVWCCRIDCKRCSRVVEMHFCN